MSGTITVTVTENIVYELAIDTSGGFPDGYDFASDPDGLLDTYVADVTSTSPGFHTVSLERDITIDG